MTNKKDKKTEVTTIDVQVAELIRKHKKQCSATDDEINVKLVITITLDAD
ncbi:RNA polymerase sigma factor RpoD, partial [Streptococcus suis]